MDPFDSPHLGPLVLRLLPGDDLRGALEAAVAARGLAASFVLAGIGSLRPARIRLAGAEEVRVVDDDCELLTLSGSVGTDASHLHMSVADAQGRVLGGHVGYGSIVRTTAEVALLPLPDVSFSREHDPATGWAELVVRPVPARGSGGSRSSP
ncbi:PPC domain-containing DNA-binding protein [Variovorax jilinensis]